MKMMKNHNIYSIKINKELIIFKNPKKIKNKLK